MQFLSRLALGIALVCVSAAAFGQPAQPPAIQQLKNNPCGARLAINLACVNPLGQRVPTVNDDTLDGYKLGDQWCVPTLGKCWIATQQVTAGAASWQFRFQTAAFPLDVAAQQGLQSLGWWGTQRATNNVNVVALNKAIDLWRSTDGTTKTIGWMANGDIDYVTADAFCAPATTVNCQVSKVYDQSFDISTGALQSFDATQTPGLQISAATVATGGSGCTPGSQTFTVVGGSGTATQFTGTVTGGGVLSGTLTITVLGSYYVYPPAATPSATGGGCAVAPTITPTQSQKAPTWPANTSVNSHRSINFSTRYCYGNNMCNSNFVGNLTQWLDLPAGVATNHVTTSVFFAGNGMSALNVDPVFFATGPSTQNFNFGMTGDITSTTANIPAPQIREAVTTSLPAPALTSPAVWAFTVGSATSTVSVGNVTTSWAQVVGGAAVTGGTIGKDVTGKGRGQMDLLQVGVFNSVVSAANQAKIVQAMNQQASMVPQSNNLVVVVGDSIGYGNATATGSTWPTGITRNNWLKSQPSIINISVPGGAFVAHSYDFTANFAENWSAIYNSVQPIYVLVALGTNDLGVPFPPCDAACLFARAQAYATLLYAQGSNVRLIMCTLLPRSDAVVPDIAVYNQLLRDNARKSIADGGLGAIDIIDFAADPEFNQVSFADYLVGGLHPNDAGYLAMTRDAATVLNNWLK